MIEIFGYFNIINILSKQTFNDFISIKYTDDFSMMNRQSKIHSISVTFNSTPDHFEYNLNYFLYIFPEGIAIF